MDPVLRQGATWSQRLGAATTNAGSVAADVNEDWTAWRSAVDPDDAGLFSRRLDWDDLTPESARQLLSSAAVSETPEWYEELAAMRQALRSHRGRPDPALADLPFACVLSPMVDDTWTRMLAATPDDWLAPLTPGAVTVLRHELGRRLSAVATPTWMSEFAGAQPTGHRLMLQLDLSPISGSTQRYDRWCHEQADDGMAGILQRYPVLGRLLGTTALNWRRSTMTMLERIHRHQSELRELFGTPPEAKITGLTTGLSDPHRGGHSVAILEFGDTSVVYKPKDIRLDAAFQDLVRQVNTTFGDAPMHAISVLPGDGPYGFTSFVEHATCPPEELPQFYRSAGRMLALLYLLGATDAHYENLMAQGPSMALIDSETLLHSPVFETATDDLETAVANSVLRTGMLPAWMVVGTDQKSFDVSALGFENVQGKRLDWKGLNTDDMVLTRVVSPGDVVTSLPIPARAPNPLAAYTDDLLAGFRDVHLAARSSLGAPLLQMLGRSRGLSRRIVLRATRVYAVVQEQASSPRALRTANGRALALEQLTRSSLVGGRRDPDWQVFQAELSDMENMDVPFFEYGLGTSDVHGGRGPISNLTRVDAIHQAVERIGALDDEDLVWQQALIRGSIRARYMTVDPVGGTRTVASGTPTPDPVDVAATLMAEIEAAAFTPPGDRNPLWLTFSRLPDGQRVGLGPVGHGWYDGRAGIAAAQQWGADHGIGQAPPDTADPVLRGLTSDDDYTRFRYLRNMGLGFTGVGGVLRWLRLPTSDPALASPHADLLHRLVETIPVALVSHDRSRDLTGGVAGLMGPLALTFRETSSSAAGRLLGAAAEHLMTAQRRDGAWLSQMGARPLTGYAHGAAGYGLALLEAGTALEREDLIAAGAAAFAYESAVFDPALANWPDFRDLPGNPGSMTAWCHGAAGVGLSRVRALQLLPTHNDAAQWQLDLDTAMHATASDPLPAADHLCCGLTGRAAILRIAGRARGNPEWLAASAHLTSLMLAQYAEQGGLQLPDDGGPLTSTPGLMWGSAGIAAHLMCGADDDLAAFLL